MTSLENAISALFDELVPARGKADTVAGEIVRAVNRIAYRSYNDGDHVGVGYGKETCNPAARYLMANAGEVVEVATRNLWGVRDDDRYDELLEALEDAVLVYLENHSELKETPNTEDMLDYRDSTYDVDDEDEEDW